MASLKQIMSARVNAYLTLTLLTFTFFTSAGFASDFSEVEGDYFCPADMRLMSQSFAQKNQDIVCNQLQDWSVARLAGRASISGAANNCEIYPVDHRSLGTSICVPLTDFSIIRGILLQGGFRSQDELIAMSDQEWREALITELANRTVTTKDRFDAMGNTQLAGVGALYLSLRDTQFVSESDLSGLTPNDMRQSLIFNLNRQTGTPIGALSRLSNIELVKRLFEG